MSGFFAPDSALMRFLTRIADLMILNLVFIATSIPIVTLGASLTALNFTAMRIARGQCDSVTGDYFRSFRRNFRQATLIGLVFLLLAAVLAAWYVVVTNLDVRRGRGVHPARDLVPGRVRVRAEPALRLPLSRQLRGHHPRGAAQRAADVVAAPAHVR